MRILQGHCFACGNVLLWESSSDQIPILLRWV